MTEHAASEQEWLDSFRAVQPLAAELLARSEAEQRRRGYFHTLREICQQPATLLATCECMLRDTDALKRLLSGARGLILTGSGSSEYVGDCVCLPLQNDLCIPAETIGGGTILTHASNVLPLERPALAISFARSGDSPESVGVISLLLESQPAVRHLILTCNPAGKLAEAFRNHTRVHLVLLDERTNDRSLVMTSSFTGLLIAARALGFLEKPQVYRSLCEQLSPIITDLLRDHFGSLAGIAKMNFRRSVFLASAPRLGAAKESALKMLEMTAGRVTTLSETYLGLRHGPMTYVNDEALIVAFLSSDPAVRAYELDLLHELDRKRLGMCKLVVGENIPAAVIRENDFALECAGLTQVGDESACVVDVVVGQLLGFFRCLAEGLRPDSPSETGVISRVVESFALHRPDIPLT
jgi:tagatose-6-phosphate ketose/aldose isomerase